MYFIGYSLCQPKAIKSRKTRDKENRYRVFHVVFLGAPFFSDSYLTVREQNICRSMPKLIPGNVETLFISAHVAAIVYSALFTHLTLSFMREKTRLRKETLTPEEHNNTSWPRCCSHADRSRPSTQISWSK